MFPVLCQRVLRVIAANIPDLTVGFHDNKSVYQIVTIIGHLRHPYDSKPIGTHELNRPIPHLIGPVDTKLMVCLCSDTIFL